MADFSDVLPFVYAQEAGYQCIHSDPGNWSTGEIARGTLIGTNRGISAPVLIEYLKSIGSKVAVTPAYMRALPQSVSDAIYGRDYWLRLDGPDLPAGVDLMVFDDGVNRGVGGAACILQRTVGLSGADVDGSIGPQTLAAVAAVPLGALINSLEAAQEAAYRADAGFSQFGAEWLRRLAARKAASLTLAGITAAPAAPVEDAADQLMEQELQQLAASSPTT
jgi:lysozyme family protein